MANFAIDPKTVSALPGFSPVMFLITGSESFVCNCQGIPTKGGLIHNGIGYTILPGDSDIPMLVEVTLGEAHYLIPGVLVEKNPED